MDQRESSYRSEMERERGERTIDLEDRIFVRKKKTYCKEGVAKRAYIVENVVAALS